MTHECVSDEAVAADVEKYGLSVMLPGLFRLCDVVLQGRRLSRPATGLACLSA
jgi:hypothetical protein